MYSDSDRRDSTRILLKFEYIKLNEMNLEII